MIEYGNRYIVPSPAIEQQDRLSLFAGTLEFVLKNKLFQDVPQSAFRGQFSMYPDRVGEALNGRRAYHLGNQCGYISERLRTCLEDEGIESSRQRSAHLSQFDHAYLTTYVAGIEILIDPTIQQFIDGHTHVFVGTREQLKMLLKEKVGPGKPYRYTEEMIELVGIRKSAEEIFDIIWGNTSLPADDEWFQTSPEQKQLKRELDIIHADTQARIKEIMDNRPQFEVDVFPGVSRFFRRKRKES